MKKWVKVYLCNVSSIGTHCGYGEGRTREEAIKDALDRARREYGPNVMYNPQSGQVEFSAPVYC